jgi:hypothetical protein
MAIIAGVLYGIANVTSEIIYENYNFLTAIVWTKAFVGIVALYIILNPKNRKDLFKNQNKKSHSV